MIGKITSQFSKHWKNWDLFFQTLENADWVCKAANHPGLRPPLLEKEGSFLGFRSAGVPACRPAPAAG